MLGKLNKEQIESLLKQEVTGRIGCHAGGKTYVVPITYVYDGTFIICHTRAGLKVELMRNNPQVCFEIDKMENMTNWESVIIQGVYEELEGDTANAAFQKFFTKIKPMLPSSTAHPHEHIEKIRTTDISKTGSVIFRIRIIEKTGRFEKN
jgi:nitroimidazol reductase NimA-like FMN-containing flavoprotein (pyridoxamine 5'-phosphate oxidase superfamily)